MPGSELIGKEEKGAVDSIFDKGRDLERGSKVLQFEKELAKKVGAQYCHCVCNGTSALKAALFALGVKRGDEVITQSFTFIATVEAILDSGAKPVIVEIDRSLNMDPFDLEKKISDKTKVIIPVHMAGVPAKMKEIIKIAQKNNISVLEDSAQALGASFEEKFLGTIGQAGIYSFDTGKIVTTGEGGAVVTDNKDIYYRVREFSDHGHEQNPKFPRGRDTRSFWGFNYKMAEIPAAIGQVQLKRIDYILKKQRENKKKIKEGIKNIKNIEFREIPDIRGDAGDTLIFFMESKEKASEFAELMSKRGLWTKNLPDAIDWHFAGIWSHIFSEKEIALPKSEDLLRRAIAIPVLVKTSDQEINKVIGVIREIEK